MPETSGVLSRPDKLDDAQTVLYEIDMLRWSMERLSSQPPSWAKADKWVYLEDFLLHYRNLIEFFGKTGDDPTDLSIRRPERIWGANPPDKSELEVMTKPELWQKYDTRDNSGAISKYLHHCTTQRTHSKVWDVRAMFEEIRPLIERLESKLPEYKPSREMTATRGCWTLGGSSTTSTRALDLGFNR